VTDRLLTTRRERARETAPKLAACLLPTGALVAATFAVGGTPAVSPCSSSVGLAAVGVATSVETVRSAVVGGALLTVGLFALLGFFASVRGA
jgi:hypothetical protein